MDGTLYREGDAFAIRFERILPHPIERVWAALTERDRLAEWLGEVAIDLRPGGAIRIVFSGVEPEAVLETVVDEIDPPRLLRFRFDDRDGDGNMVRFELAERGKATHLILTQSRVPSARELADNAAGWHLRIDMLGASLDDGMQALSWDRIEELHTAYAAQVMALSRTTP